MINPNPNSWPLPTPRIVRFPTPFGNNNLLHLLRCINALLLPDWATVDRGSRGIRDQPRNPPKYAEKRIRINFPFPCPSQGRAHACKVGSPARWVGSFRGYPFVSNLLAGSVCLLR